MLVFAYVITLLFLFRLDVELGIGINEAAQKQRHLSQLSFQSICIGHAKRASYMIVQ